MRAFLEPLKLQQYAPEFDAEGVDDPDDLICLTMDDLIRDFGMKKHHAAKLLRWLATRGGSPRVGGQGEREVEHGADDMVTTRISGDSECAVVLPAAPTATLASSIAAARGEMSWDFFLSHYIAEMGDIVGLVATKLEHRGFRPWFNKWNGKGNAAEGRIEVTNEGMEYGVLHSSIFVLFLSNKVFTRPFCRLEILSALKAKRPFVTFIETGRHGRAFDFGNATKEGVPQSFHAIIDQIALQIGAIPLRRDIEEQELMLNKLTRAYLFGYSKVLTLDAVTMAVAERGEAADGGGPWASLRLTQGLVSDLAPSPIAMPPHAIAKARKKVRAGAEAKADAKTKAAMSGVSASGAAIVAHLQSPYTHVMRPTSLQYDETALMRPRQYEGTPTVRWDGTDWPAAVILAGHDSHWRGLMGTCVVALFSTPAASTNSRENVVLCPFCCVCFQTFRARTPSMHASFGEPVGPPAKRIHTSIVPLDSSHLVLLLRMISLLSFDYLPLHFVRILLPPFDLLPLTSFLPGMCVSARVAFSIR